ncbi:MAG: Co2+/Mg2+ efflux protein ApaG [Gemmatimonadota bacterium]
MQKFYYRVSSGIRVTVLPAYAPEHSDPQAPRFLFVYHIRIENTGDYTAQLLWRHWYIHDDVEGDSEVEGEGVIGEQPVLAPGDVHEYESYCVLKGPSGWMEGYYEFARPDSTQFRVDIPRFQLRV